MYYFLYFLSVFHPKLAFWSIEKRKKKREEIRKYFVVVTRGEKDGNILREIEREIYILTFLFRLNFYYFFFLTLHHI